MSGKHVIVGGLGNLGRHLQRALLANGCAVRVLDRPSPSNNKAGEHESVECIPFTLGWDDSRDLCKALEGAETVYSVVTPDVQHGTAQDFYRTNQLGMQHLVKACKSAGSPQTSVCFFISSHKSFCVLSKSIGRRPTASH